MKKILIIYVYTVFSFLYASSLEFYENSYAVLIGINNYVSEDIPDLGYAVEDAESIANLLISKLGYNEENIHLLLNEDATQINIKNTLYQIAMKAGQNDRILVFYGGHGETIPVPSSDGELGYLLPVDAKRENLYTSGLSMQEFKQFSEFTSAKHVLYLVDVCYGGIMTVATRSLAKNDFSDDEKYLKKITTEPARQIITAGGKGDKAQERAIWGHSAFTKELLSGIEDGLADSDQNGYITSNELGIYLSKKVYITSEENQTPVNGRYGSGEGEFVFINPAHIENFIEDKVDDVLSSSPVNIIDNTQMDRVISELKNAASLISNINNMGENSVSTFYQENQFLDSAFVYPYFRKPEAKDGEFILKYFNPYYDIKNWRFSSLLIPYFIEHRRVSGLEMGMQFEASQFKPMVIKLEYIPIYNFSLKTFYQFANITRHPWGKKNQKFVINYYDWIESNDNWMRNNNYNTLSSLIFGKDYQDHFHNKGYKLDYTLRLNDLISLNTSYSNTYQKNMPSIKKYKNSIFKKATLDNRSNFKTAPYLFEDGRHTNVQTILSFNKLNTTIQKTFTCTVEISDTSQSIIDQPAPQVYLISESKSWPNNQYEMKKPAFGFEKEIHHLMGGLVEINLSNNTQDITAAISDTTTAILQDSIYQIQYFYEVTVNLPPGSHAYRFLVDNIRYQIDDINEKAIIGNGKAVSIVSIDTPYRFDLGYEYADSTLGGDFSYERLTFNYSSIHTLSNNDALLFRLIGGWSKKHLPVQKLFYVGGEGTVRGFDYLDTKKFSGRQMLLAKLEYHYFNNPFIEDLFLFYDIAAVGNKFDFQNPIISYGLGTMSDFRTINDGSSDYELGIIIYKTKDSNNGNWGIEFICNYFFNNLDEDIFILP